MKVTVLAFGIAKDIFGGSSVMMAIEGNTVHDLKAVLELAYPRLRQIASYMIAVNNEYANNDVVINANDEVAIIPPVSGG